MNVLTNILRKKLLAAFSFSDIRLRPNSLGTGHACHRANFKFYHFIGW